MTANSALQKYPLRARFMGPTWGPPGSWRPQVGPMLAPWILLSGSLLQKAAPVLSVKAYMGYVAYLGIQILTNVLPCLLSHYIHILFSCKSILLFVIDWRLSKSDQQTWLLFSQQRFKCLVCDIYVPAICYDISANSRWYFPRHICWMMTRQDDRYLTDGI